MIIFGEFQGILLVSMQNCKESVVLDLVLFHVFFLQVLAINFTCDNGRSDKVLLGQSQAHLLENVLDLVAFRK